MSFTADKPVQLMIDQVKTPPPVPSEVCEMEIPLDPPWDGDQAEAWWNLHMSEIEALEDSFRPSLTGKATGEHGRLQPESVRSDG